MSYKLTFDGIETRFANKDEVIGQLVAFLSGDGAVPIQLLYPDGSFWGDDL